MSKHIKPGTRLSRTFAVDRAGIDIKARTVALSFSSEQPYDRWWGREILDHSPQSIRLGRLTSGGPLLMDHDARDQVGVIESVSIDGDRRGRAVVRFGKSARADEVFNDVLDGIRSNVSVGYVIHSAQLVEKGEEIDTFRVDDWEPHEISLVSVPADSSVGVGRSAEEVSPVIQIQEKRQMSVETTRENTVDEAAIRAAAAQDANAAALKRINDIEAIGRQMHYYDGNKHAADFIRAGKSAEEFTAFMLKQAETKPLPTADIGMSKKEAQSFSFVRAISALSATGADRERLMKAAAFEMECSNAVAEKMGKESRGMFVPNEVQQRDLTVGTATAGGNLVATDLLAGSFIDMLRNRMALAGMGATMLTGLNGNIAIPRQTGGATAYWVAESGAPTESQAAFDQVPMSPKTVGAFSDISRKLLLQSSIGIEQFVRSDLARVLGLEIDRVGVNGSGASNQPTGILNTSGIGSVAGGTNGLAPTWDHIVDLETAVAVANADIASLGYLTNAKVRGKLKKTFVDGPGSGERVWQRGADPLNGYMAAVSNQVPSNLTKGTSTGVCSAILFGNFSDLIMGFWGVLDLMVDPYSNSTSGTVRVVALQDVDVAARHAESFAAMKDALTA